MRVPIQYALSYPSRLDSDFERLDLFKVASLNFQRPDLEVFPCLALAYRALREGGSTATVLNAANEVLVEFFLNDRIGFYDIPKYIEMAMDDHAFIDQPSLEDTINMDTWTRSYINKLLTSSI